MELEILKFINCILVYLQAFENKGVGIMVKTGKNILNLLSKEIMVIKRSLSGECWTLLRSCFFQCFLSRLHKIKVLNHQTNARNKILFSRHSGVLSACFVSVLQTCLVLNEVPFFFLFSCYYIHV